MQSPPPIRRGASSFCKGDIVALERAERSGAQTLLEALEREGVEVIFGYPGGTIMPFYDALYGHPMRHILVRHEAAAAFAAGGYARTSGRVGVCCATSGPGATNLVTGLVDAMMDSIPVVAITGQVRMRADGHRRLPRSRRVRDHAVHDQGLDPASPIRPASTPRCAKRSRSRAAAGRVRCWSTFRPTCSKRPYVPEQNAPRKVRDVKPVATASRCRLRPMRFATRTVRWRSPAAAPRAASGQAFRELCALLGLPHTTTICGLGASDPNDVHGLGMLGMHGTKASNLAVHTADVVLAFGMRFDDRVTGRARPLRPRRDDRSQRHRRQRVQQDHPDRHRAARRLRRHDRGARSPS